MYFFALHIYVHYTAVWFLRVCLHFKIHGRIFLCLQIFFPSSSYYTLFHSCLAQMFLEGWFIGNFNCNGFEPFFF